MGVPLGLLIVFGWGLLHGRGVSRAGVSGSSVGWPHCLHSDMCLWLGVGIRFCCDAVAMTGCITPARRCACARNANPRRGDTSHRPRGGGGSSRIRSWHSERWCCCGREVSLRRLPLGSCCRSRNSVVCGRLLLYWTDFVASHRLMLHHTGLRCRGQSRRRTGSSVGVVAQ